MDVGNFTASELAYRKMMVHDPNFLVGLTLLGRITKDLKERQQIEQQLERRRNEIIGDEKLLLNTFIALVNLTNLRETDPEEAKAKSETLFQGIEDTLAGLVHLYPDEVYYKAEYIEVLHRNHGQQIALDSLYNLASLAQQKKPFLLGYAANMEAEAGHFEKALTLAKELSIKTSVHSPKPHTIYSDIYFKMGNFEKAHDYIQKALKLDSGNIDALRLNKKIEEGLKR